MTTTVTPLLTERADDLGWLASTPPDYPYRFAAEGPDREAAERAFLEAVLRWENITD